MTGQTRTGVGGETLARVATNSRQLSSFYWACSIYCKFTGVPEGWKANVYVSVADSFCRLQRCPLCGPEFARQSDVRPTEHEEI